MSVITADMLDEVVADYNEALSKVRSNDMQARYSVPIETRSLTSEAVAEENAAAVILSIATIHEALCDINNQNTADTQETVDSIVTLLEELTRVLGSNHVEYVRAIRALNKLKAAA